MKKPVIIALFLPVLFYLTGCADFFYVPLTVVAFSPDREVFLPGENPAVWVEFSAAVDPTRAEQAFSLSKDTTLVQGRFAWNGNRLAFTPYETFETGCQYILKVDTSVEDLSGNSLEREFLFRFRFGEDMTRPEIVDAYPATSRADCDPYDHEILGALLPDDLYHPVSVTFSEPVDRASFYSAFSISPDINGVFSWPSDSSAVFTPAEPYQWQTEYTVTINPELKDMTGNTLADIFTSHFFFGTDNAPPVPISVTSIIPDPARQDENASLLTENVIVTEWEADWNILIQFDEPVTGTSVKNNITFNPAWDYKIVYDPLQPDRIVLKRISDTNKFHYGEIYTMTIKAGVSDLQGNKTTRSYSYLFRVNGPYTRPPEVLEVRYLPDDTVAFPVWEMLPPLQVISMPNTFDVTPEGDIRRCVFDFYFTLADHTIIPTASFFENFSIEIENGCITTPEFVVIDTCVYGDTIEGPELATALFENQAVVRVYMRLINNVNTGTITLKLFKNCADQSTDNPLLHNTMTEDWSLRLRDPIVPSGG